MDEFAANEPSSFEDAEQEQKRLEFVRILLRHERRIYAYVLSIVTNWSDADEIYQETILRLWKEFDRFEPGTNFAAWAVRVAHFQILSWRKKAQRSKLVFGQEIVDLVAQAHTPANGAQEDVRHRALSHCMERLTATNRDLLAQCYAENTKIKDVAERMNRSTESVYKALQRIRLALHNCISEQLAVEGIQ